MLPKLNSEAQELQITIDKFNITSVVTMPNDGNIKIFKPHLNSYSSGPIKFN